VLQTKDQTGCFAYFLSGIHISGLCTEMRSAAVEKLQQKKAAHRDDLWMKKSAEKKRA
jgi:hypothetical protein